ncbi:tripartite tricarboxylate transporter TctB family protein [Paracoccus sp. MKU1]|uniref:tripartite tricarboxylate transporter TctB family protein n=1 Tax=Paracoccus sp. MKU1 TaxID=1745182 RepID=UPI0007191683|nr:tripartite tricarboxylate transporter TctB family protein [Paracoccus sp. MKU1]KRW97619.1 hypothetical protein AQY21_02620 [Paracoccus sp. MKU1]
MDIKNLLSSALLLAVGSGFAWSAMTGMEIGTARRMGPGYFPLILAGIIILIGLIIGVKGLMRSERFQPDLAPLRAFIAILGAPIFFGATIRGLGFLPAVALTTLLASLAASSRLSTILLITAGITVFCLLVFYYGLGLPIRLLGPWLGMLT